MDGRADGRTSESLEIPHRGISFSSRPRSATCSIVLPIHRVSKYLNHVSDGYELRRLSSHYLPTAYLSLSLSQAHYPMAYEAQLRLRNTTAESAGAGVVPMLLPHERMTARSQRVRREYR